MFLMASLKRFDGELMIDHRASPGIPENLARPVGLPGIGEGTLFECATLSCVHCGGVWVKKPARTRPREYCRKCDRYICDACAAAASQSGYMHRSFQELADLVRSGRYQLSGSASAPILIPIKGGD